MDKFFWVLAIVGMLYMCTGDDEDEVAGGTGGGGGPTQLEAEEPVQPEKPEFSVSVEETDDGYSVTIGKVGEAEQLLDEAQKTADNVLEEMKKHAESDEETGEDLTIGETPEPTTSWRESW